MTSRSLHDWLRLIEAERAEVEAWLARAGARRQVRLAEAVAAAREHTLRQLIDRLQAEQRAPMRQRRPWWRQLSAAEDGRHERA